MSLAEALEVVDFARSGHLMDAFGPLPERVLLLHDFKEARHRATSQPDVGSLWTVDGTDLREHQAAQFLLVEQSLPADQRDEVRRCSNELADTLSGVLWPRLKALGFGGAHNEVSADLTNVAKSRLLQGKAHEFWEQLHALYVAGLWPCGWDGEEYPAGRFVVFNAQPRPTHDRRKG